MDEFDGSTMLCSSAEFMVSCLDHAKNFIC